MDTDDRLFATALEASVAAMKAAFEESARNALLNDLNDLLVAMRCNEHKPGYIKDPFNNGYIAAVLEVRTWMVSQGLDLNAGNGTT